MSYNWQAVRCNPLSLSYMHAHEISVQDNRRLSSFNLVDSIHNLDFLSHAIVYKVWGNEDSDIYASSDDVTYYALISWTDETLDIVAAVQFLHSILVSLQAPPESRVGWVPYFQTPRGPSMELNSRVPDAGALASLPSRRSTENRHRTYIVPMPFVSFKESAACLADKDLKLTRVAILRCLRKLISRKPARRPIKAVEAWRGYTQALVRYGIQVALECKRRGFTDKSLEKLQSLLTTEQGEKPNWIYWKKCRESYQSYLKLQDYRRYVWGLLNWFWKIDRYIQRHHHSIHHLLQDEWGYNPYNLMFSDLRNLEHRVRELAAARQEFLSPCSSFYLWNIELSDTICYPN